MKLSQGQVMTTSKGYIFDIKRFATHDGKGIRTTVFFKGCPLRCKWCQNPEGLSYLPQVLYMESKCMHCLSCVHASKQGGVKCVNDKICISRNIKEDWDAICDVCPTLALSMDAKEYTVEKCVHEILKDEIFFKREGGVTFSGGEPFLQSDILIDLLKACKEKGIHTAIETSLYTDLENVQKALPYLDQIYCDCKLYDENLHKQYTGVSNEKILKNIAYLLQSNKKAHVIVRTPLIPTMTASFENISSISEFLVSCYEDVHYEILNYNPLAQSKYAYLDMEYCFKENPKMYSSEKMQEFYDCAKQNGIKNLVID